MLHGTGTKLRALALVGALAVGLGGGIGALAGTAGATGPAPNQPPGLDHFLCYNSNTVAGVAPTFKVPMRVKLHNQFSPRYFRARPTTVSLHCNPALKSVDTPAGLQTYPPASPSWHLLCFNIVGTQKPNTHVVKVTNQFGTATLQTGPPSALCLPSLKSLSSPPSFKPPAATEIQPDHFVCYPVNYLPGSPPFTPPASVGVSDQFSASALTSVNVGPPTTLCVPTQKTVKKVVTPITNPPAHLLCFQVTPTPLFTGLVWDQNQFGTGAVAIRSTNSLCLPSFKQLIR